MNPLIDAARTLGIAGAVTLGMLALGGLVTRGRESRRLAPAAVAMGFVIAQVDVEPHVVWFPAVMVAVAFLVPGALVNGRPPGRPGVRLWAVVVGAAVVSVGAMEWSGRPELVDAETAALGTALGAAVGLGSKRGILPVVETPREEPEEDEEPLPPHPVPADPAWGAWAVAALGVIVPWVALGV